MQLQILNTNEQVFNGNEILLNRNKRFLNRNVQINNEGKRLLVTPILTTNTVGLNVNYYMYLLKVNGEI